MNEPSPIDRIIAIGRIKSPIKKLILIYLELNGFRGERKELSTSRLASFCEVSLNNVQKHVNELIVENELITDYPDYKIQLTGKGWL